MGVLDRLIYNRVLNRWSKVARAAETTDLSKLRDHRARARRLQSCLNDLIAVADSRLTLPLIGTKSMRRPAGSDWSWRPQLWREPLMTPGYAAVENKTSIGPETTIFHDCKISELTVRQLRNHRDSDLAPFGVRMDVFRFDGSYLSMVIDLPEQAVQGLKKRHLLRLDTIVEMEKPLEIFARLNIKHGPNTEQLVRELPLHEEDVIVEFDLAYTKLNEKRVEKMWLDLIFEGPEMNQIILRDVTFSRRPRAEL